MSIDPMPTAAAPLRRAVWCVVLGVAAFAGGVAGRADAHDDPLRAILRAPLGGLREATASLFGAGDGALIDVSGDRALPVGAAVTLNRGSCAHPGAAVFPLAPLTDQQSVTTLHRRLSRIVAAAPIVVIHTASDPASAAFACGTITTVPGY